MTEVLRDDVNDGESMRTHVPWFCVDELKDVYSNIFLNDLTAVKQGYECLLMWKARHPTLPPGIEAMFNLCDVILQDGKFSESSDEIYVSQLRLMYATTIMRFLNLVLDMQPGSKGERKSLWLQAEAVGIPKWIVEIRHDSAHGSIMPDIAVLRSAAKFSINWLKERYWERALNISDLVVEEGEHILTDYEHRVDQVLECWESFSIYDIAGFSKEKHVKNRDLWVQVNEIGTSLKSKLHKPTKKVKKIDTALSILNQKVKEMLRNRKAHGTIKQIFIKKMLSGDIFLPSEKVVSLFKAKTVSKELPERLIRMWSSVMKDLWESESLSELVAQLVTIFRDVNETPCRRRYAVLWTQQILHSLIMVKEGRRMLDAISARSKDFQLSHKYFEMYPDCSYQEQLAYAIGDAITEQRPELKDAYVWAHSPLPSFFLTTELLEKCLANPPPSDILLILPSVMELMDPPLSSDMQLRLQDCVRIYCGQEDSSKTPTHDKVFSLADVVGLRSSQTLPLRKIDSTDAANDSQVEDNVVQTNMNVDVTRSSVKSPWNRSSEMLGWSRCSLGLLPWQRDDAQNVWRSFETKCTWVRKSNQS